MLRLQTASRVAGAAALAVGAVAALTACASTGPAGPPPAAMTISRAGVPAELSTFPLTVYPTPRQAAYSEYLLPLEGHRRVDVSSSDFLDVLEDLELLETWRSLPDEGYVLQVGWHDDRTTVVIAGADEAGSRWAELALAQVSARSADGTAAVRDCLVIDAPGFPLRGNKRPQAWEEAYRANFAWGARDNDDFARRELVPFFAPGSPFDATADGVRQALEMFRPWQAAGVRRFAIKFDDVGFALTPQSQLAFGEYPRAVVVYLGVIREALQSVDPEARLYYLPQTYWWEDPRFPSFAAAIRGSGGLASDVGLVLTGPQIISESISAPGLDAARNTFGASAAKALIYDNLGREGDWGPLTGRDAALADVADAVFGERGTPVNRLTRLDWSWNPPAYEPERSWRRALFELAGPHGFGALRDACDAFRRRAGRETISAAIDAFEQRGLGAHVGPLEHSELVRLLRRDLKRVRDESATR